MTSFGGAPAAYAVMPQGKRRQAETMNPKIQLMA
jgi:hypothetical protein